MKKFSIFILLTIITLIVTGNSQGIIDPISDDDNFIGGAQELSPSDYSSSEFKLAIKAMKGVFKDFDTSMITKAYSSLVAGTVYTISLKFKGVSYDF